MELVVVALIFFLMTVFGVPVLSVIAFLAALAIVGTVAALLLYVTWGASKLAAILFGAGMLMVLIRWCSEAWED